MSKIRAVIIGFSHTHCNEIAPYLIGQPDSELVGVADTNSGLEKLPPLRFTPGWNFQNVTENYCSNAFEDYRQMLDELKPDIAYILTDNAEKPQVIEECAKRGVHVCIEKPIALSMKEANKIDAAIKKHGIEAVVNWPIVWRPYVHQMKAVLDSGIIGTPIKLRYINGHSGPYGKGIFQRGVEGTDEETSYKMMTDEQRSKTWFHQKSRGGGAYLDVGGYGCFYSYWLLGKNPDSVMSYGLQLNTPFGDTEDDIAGIIKYPDNKMAVIEGTWTTPRAVIPSGPMVICTNGAVMCTGGAENNPGVAAFDMYGRPVAIPEINFEDKFKNMPWMWANHVNTGEPVYEMLTFETNLKVMAILEALMRSNESGRTEHI